MSYEYSEWKNVLNLFSDNSGKYFTQEQIEKECNLNSDTIEEILLDLKNDHIIKRKYIINPKCTKERLRNIVKLKEKK